MSRRASITLAAVWAVVVSPAPVQPHPGGTDDQGCHVCRTDCEKWDEEAGERHCHGDDESGEGEESADGGDDRDLEELDLAENQRATVERVLDGDTIVVETPGADGATFRVRILGIDCPESHENPKCRREGRQGGETCAEQIPEGREATRAVERLIGGESVRLESGDGDGDFERGGYDRILAYIRTSEGRDLGRLLIRRGFCDSYGDEYPHARHRAYERAERRRSRGPR